MVRDGIYYALGMLAAAAVLAWLTSPAYAIVPLAAGAFFLWFFRDPERDIPAEPGAVVSAADGKVTDVSTVQVDGAPRRRISVFLNVFDVHVNRAPIAGIIQKAEYRRGSFHNAMGAASSELNEQNVVTVAGAGQIVVFKQIAGLLARRIVFHKAVGQSVARGERVGMIKFGSRVDILLDPSADVRVKIGDRVRGGSSVLAVLPGAQSAVPAPAGSQPQGVAR